MSKVVNIRHLRSFIAVAEHESFTAAAETLAITQSALTATIRQIETETGTRLFDRTTRRVSLTAEGHHLLPEARRVLLRFDGAISDLRAMAQGQRGELKIAAAASLIEVLLADTIRRYKQRNPEIKVVLSDSNAEHLEDMVLSGEVDFALAARFSQRPELDHEPVVADDYMCVCDPQHPMAKDPSPLDWADLPKTGFVSFTPDTGVGAFLSEQFATLSGASRTDEVSSTTTLFALLPIIGGYSIVPALVAARARREGFAVRQLNNPRQSRQIYLMSRRMRAISPVSKLFYAEFKGGLDARRLPRGVRLIGPEVD
ncbi:MAG: LysR family transcriptional regulator [Pseudomonadota bacterium]|nr:LysR family transcriptional regulator [Pseudomonadota bacterium]